ncbi:hypothetical protein GSM99_15930 [Proteus terrae subsp. cibarius]|nr:hypothetical protein GSM99_15930 [Proteus terrae subsp. cibarius]
MTSRCAGTKTGCVNVILVTLDGGKTFRPTNGGFGQHTDYPGFRSASFDIIVTGEGFYLGKSSSSRLKMTNLMILSGENFILILPILIMFIAVLGIKNPPLQH